MKVITKKLEVEKLVLVDGVPTVSKESKTLYFAMNLKAQRMIEEKLNKPLVSLFSGKNQNELVETMMEANTLLTLIGACYLCTDNGTIRQDEVSMNEFIQSEYSQIVTNQDLIGEIANAIAEYFGADKASQPSNGKASKKK